MSNVHMDKDDIWDEMQKRFNKELIGVVRAVDLVWEDVKMTTTTVSKC